MKIAILYHSESGNTREVAQIIAKGVREAGNVDVKCFSIDGVDDQYLAEAKAVIFGCPTYHADFSWQMKKWFDELGNNKLKGKLGSIFATENYLGGGADFALLTLAGHMLVDGMLVYSGGSTEGQPYTHFGVVCIKDGDEWQKERARIFGKRVALKAIELF